MSRRGWMRCRMDGKIKETFGASAVSVDHWWKKPCLSKVEETHYPVGKELISSNHHVPAVFLGRQCFQ